MIPLGILAAASPRIAPAPVPEVPADIFAVPDTPGFWFDPYDLSTLFQDADCEVPVENDGDWLWVARDKSGNGLDAVAESSGTRIKWRTDGSRCWFEGNPSGGGRLRIGGSYADTNFSALHLIARARSAADTKGLVGKPNASPAASPWLRWALVHQTGARLQTWFQGAQYATANGSWNIGSDVTASLDSVVGQLRVGSTTASFTPATITYPNNLPAYFFDDGNGNYFNGRCYGLVGVGRAMVGSEASDLRDYMDTR
ncbi:hypothetical protein Psesu_1180 [Pseudoxanthomonas suwonensis 11-1]|uniref:Uncharacterized protein n=1 Tax=Pseudoxanthomonas suwonensis (strain 11-1) TaxID=743721 RepID=E6WS80_PSEUU|nr:hypothetical protein [Pseudoxanthomonas suwonensis]ADV27029.1 hypothetical protein Psesu_1180 [Pseudoxanthomonas suwonensis 11-1]